MRLGVVATGAVGKVTLGLLAERGYDDVRAFASARSAGSRIEFGGEALVVEEATPEALGAGDLDLCLFSIGTATSRELVPHAVRGGAIAVDKSSAYRLADGVPLVVPEVNGARALEHDGIVANPNCCTIPLTCVLKPLEEAAKLRRVRVATYQSVSGAGVESMERLAARAAGRARPAGGLGLRRRRVRRGGEAPPRDAQDHGAARPADQPDLRARAGDGRPRRGGVGRDRGAAVGGAGPLAARAAPGLRVVDGFPSPGAAAQTNDVLVGRVRQDPTEENGLVLFLACDNLVKGAALNAIQIAELLLSREALAA